MRNLEIVLIVLSALVLNMASALVGKYVAMSIGLKATVRVAFRLSATGRRLPYSLNSSPTETPR